MAHIVAGVLVGVMYIGVSTYKASKEKAQREREEEEENDRRVQAARLRYRQEEEEWEENCRKRIEDQRKRQEVQREIQEAAARRMTIWLKEQRRLKTEMEEKQKERQRKAREEAATKRAREYDPNGGTHACGCIDVRYIHFACRRCSHKFTYCPKCHRGSREYYQHDKPCEVEFDEKEEKKMREERQRQFLILQQRSEGIRPTCNCDMLMDAFDCGDCDQTFYACKECDEKDETYEEHLEECNEAIERKRQKKQKKEKKKMKKQQQKQQQQQQQQQEQQQQQKKQQQKQEKKERRKQQRQEKKKNKKVTYRMPESPVPTPGEWIPLDEFTGRKSFGFYVCMKCAARTWVSANAWPDNVQDCRGCEESEYPTLMWRNDTQNEKNDHSTRLDGPHDTARCGKCRQLGTPCWLA